MADPAIIASPSDAIIGAHGRIEDGQLFQVKGAPYSLLDLLGDPALVEQHRNGRFVTLRLTSSMYHRFHAPYDLAIDKVTFIHGDVWNVNPIALKRVERLFCKNERAVLRAKLPTGEALTLVPVAAILVASLRLHFLDITLNAQSRGPGGLYLRRTCEEGDELGWFEHGSTIIVLAPGDFEFCGDNVAEERGSSAANRCCASRRSVKSSPSGPCQNLGGDLFLSKILLHASARHC